MSDLDPQASVVGEEPQGKEDIGVTVDLAAKPAPTPGAEEILASKILDKIEPRLKHYENQLQGARRIIEKYEQRLSTAPLPPGPPAQPVPQTAAEVKDDLDRLVDQGQWKEAVKQLAVAEFNTQFETRRQQEAVQQETLRREQLFELSKQRVESRYPDLSRKTGNEESAVSKAFVEVYNQDQSLLSNPHGPEIAMYRMEESLQAQGVDPKTFQSKTPSPGADKVVVGRLASGTLLPSRTNLPSSSKVALSRDDKEFCDYHNIPYEKFAKQRQELETTGMIEVTNAKA